MTNANKKATTNIADIGTLKRYWLVDNPGVLKRVSEELGVSAVFVADVFHKRRSSKDRQVEIELIKRGAPGVEA